MLCLQSSGAIVVRDAIASSLKAQLANAQSGVDALAQDAIDGLQSPLSQCMRQRHTLDPDQADELLGSPGAFHGLMDEITRPLVAMIADERSFRRTIYGGIFSAYPGFCEAASFEWHTDGHFDGLEADGVNFWIPARACGADAPGIAFVRDASPNLSELPLHPSPRPEVHTSVNWAAVTDEHITSIGPIETPSFKLGDLLIFTNRTLHRTQCLPEARRGRAAFIVRYLLA